MQTNERASRTEQERVECVCASFVLVLSAWSGLVWLSWLFLYLFSLLGCMFPAPVLPSTRPPPPSLPQDTRSAPLFPCLFVRSPFLLTFLTILSLSSLSPHASSPHCRLCHATPCLALLLLGVFIFLISPLLSPRPDVRSDPCPSPGKRWMTGHLSQARSM